MDVELDLEGINSQPQTQPVDESYTELDPSPSRSIHDYWGRLYPLKSDLPCCNLKENVISVGKKHDCYLKITWDSLPEEHFNVLSDHHFQIRRTQVKVSGAWTTRTHIYDLSSQGTYVNGCCIQFSSKFQKRVQILKHDDVIGLPTQKRGCFYEAFVFVDMFAPIPHFIPHHVRRSYQVTRRLGIGAFGEVFLVFGKENCKPFAMKKMLNDTVTNDHKAISRHQKIINELEILKSLEYPHVVKLVDVIESRNENFLFLEYMGGKDLASRIVETERLDENVAKLYFYQIAHAVKYLHDRNIIHRDLKPANILMKSTSIDTLLKLSDFGLSKNLTSETVMKTMCGTKMYAAPEIIMNKGKIQYSSKVDIWSMGVLLYVCIIGSEPFSKEPHLIDYQIKNAIYAIPLERLREISTFVKSLIERMLTSNPKNRISINEIIEDTWLKDEKMFTKLRQLYCSDGIPTSLLP